MGWIELTDAPCNQPLEVKTVDGDSGWEKKLESFGIGKEGRCERSPHNLLEAQ